MKRLRSVVPLLIILMGLLVLFYPTISNYTVMKNSSRAVNNYDAKVEDINEQEYQAMLDAARAYNAHLAELQSGLGGTSALTGAVNAEAQNEEYMNLLNLNGDGMIGYITIPRLKETLPIYHGTAEAVLQVGVGHLEATSLPVGGESTHAALSGHRGLPSAKLFTDLNLVKEGDRFFIKVLKETYAYEVDKISVVLPTDTSALAIESGQDLVTLITCTPYGVNSHRLLVRAHRVPYTPAMEKEAEPQFSISIPIQYVVPLIGLAVLIIGLPIWAHWRRRKQAQAANAGAHANAYASASGNAGSVENTRLEHSGPDRTGLDRAGPDHNGWDRTIRHDDETRTKRGRHGR